MKILNMYSGFNGIINVGQYCYFIELNNNGVEYSNDKIFDIIKNFNYVVVKGNIHENKEEIKKIIKQTTKYNKKVKFEFRVDNVIKLSGLNANNVYFIISVKNNTDIKELEWFIHFNTQYIFNIQTLDEYSNILVLITTYGLDKKDCWVVIKDTYLMEKLKQQAFEDRLNFCPDFEKILW